MSSDFAKFLSRTACKGSTVLAAIGIAGCATPQINLSTKWERSHTVQRADDFIVANMEAIRGKSASLDNLATTARVGTLVGALGLGAAGLAGLHRDAAIGFASLGAVSMHGLPLFGPPAWHAICKESLEALACLSDVSRPLAGEYENLRRLEGEARRLERAYADKYEKSDSIFRGALDRLAAPAMVDLRLVTSQADRTLQQEKPLANALHDQTKRLVDNTEDLLRDRQPSIAAFRESASIILSAAAAASSAATTSAATQASQPKSLLQDSVNVRAFFLSGDQTPRQLPPEQLLAKSFVDEANDVRKEIDRSIKAIGAIRVDRTSMAACKALLVGASAPLVVEPATQEVALGMASPTKLVSVTGGNGQIFGSWTLEPPPTDLLAVSSYPEPGGMRFTFTQLKKETTKARTFHFRVSDGTSNPQRATITVTIPKES